MFELTLSLSAIALLLLLRGRFGKSEDQSPKIAIEGLESRIAPAALSAKFSAGLLTVAGDPIAGNVDIVETAGSFEVFDGTTSLGTFTGVKNIKVSVQGNAGINANLTDGGISGSLKVSASGAATIAVSAGSQIDGALVFNGNDAAQSLTLGANVVIGKSLTYNGRLGEDFFTIGAGTTIRGNATLNGTELGIFDGASAVTIEGNLRFNNTSNSLLGTFRREGGTEPVNVGGSLTYLGGRGDDSLSLELNVGGNVTFIDKASDNAFNIADGSTIQGRITMTTGSGDDRFNIQGGTVDKDITLKLGEGDNEFRYGIAGGVNVGGSVVFTGGQGVDLWQTGGGGMIITRNLTVDLGDGLNTIIASAIVSGNKVAINTGNGTDAVSIDGGALNATVKVSLGAGNDSLAGSLLRDPVSATYNGGAGTDHFLEVTLTADPLVIISFEDFT